jgi:hypothetical protein
MGWNLECDVTKQGEVGKHPLRKVMVVNFSHSTRTIKDKKSIFRLVRANNHHFDNNTMQFDYNTTQIEFNISCGTVALMVTKK